MKSLLLQYPDSTPASRIVNDLTELSRGTGNRGQRPAASFTDEDFPGLRAKLQQRSVPLGTENFATLAADQLVVNDGDSFDITGGSVELTVEDGEVTGGTFTETP